MRRAISTRAPDFRHVDTSGKPTALLFGGAKINVHAVSRDFELKAARLTPGADDFCLVTRMDLARVEERLRSAGVAIEKEPVA